MVNFIFNNLCPLTWNLLFMKIYFKSNKHFKLLNDNQKLIRKYGQQQADIIQEAFSVLEAANCLLDIPRSLRPHPLEPKSENKFALELKQPFRLIIQAYGSFTHGDYSTIKEVILVDILDYH